MNLETLLILAGLGHFGILIASLLTPRALDWKKHLAPLRPFLRTLFWVYGVFIVLTITGFGVLTLLNAKAMAAGDPVARSLAAFIAVFWSARLFVQFFIFDPREFLTSTIRKVGYHTLTVAFIAQAAVLHLRGDQTPPRPRLKAKPHPTMNTRTLVFCLQLAAAGQIVISALGFFIARMLNWKEAIANMPLLVREVFQIHGWFISLTLLIFGTLTWRFASDIAGGTHEFLRWFAAGVGIFWGLRCMMQWTHYSSVHWRGIADRTAIHWILFLSYAAFTATYLKAALG